MVLPKQCPCLGACEGDHRLSVVPMEPDTSSGPRRQGADDSPPALKPGHPSSLLEGVSSIETNLLSMCGIKRRKSGREESPAPASPCSTKVTSWAWFPQFSRRSLQGGGGAPAPGWGTLHIPCLSSAWHAPHPGHNKRPPLRQRSALSLQGFKMCATPELQPLHLQMASLSLPAEKRRRALPPWP